MENLLEKFTLNFKKAVGLAYALSRELKHQTINPEHLLYALIKQKGGVASDVLAKIKINPEELKKKIIEHNRRLAASASTEPRLSDSAKKIIEKAVLAANLHQHKYIGTEHLLAGLGQLKEKNWLDFLKTNQIALAKIWHYLPLLMKSASRFPDITESFGQKEKSAQSAQGGGPALPFLPGLMEKNNSPLESFTTDLTDRKVQENIDPVIGRGDEIQRLIQVISRRTKNNPVLLGDAGVGKTAIVEGLAKKILNQEVPDILINKKIIALDLGLTVAGTMFRGEFETRLKQIIEEIKNDPNVILFIDELHNISGAGSAQGSLDAANILKPALARGQLRCIGATTLEEYKKHIASDPALERRFQPIMVEEPDSAKTKNILQGLKQNYEKYHRITITDEAIETAINLSQRYLPDKFLPDKAIDLIDEAAAGKRIASGSDDPLKSIKQAEIELNKIRQAKQSAVIQENFTKAIDLKKQENQIIDNLAKLKQEQIGRQAVSLGQVAKQDIAELIAKITGIPASELIASEKDKLINLEKIIGQKIIGQNEAVQAVASAIRRARAGLASQKRPLGSFIFLGPSGVGKTELAKILAETIFESPKALIRLDMSEFNEPFNVSKLIGAPAGYIGYQDANKLTDAVKRRPYSVVLFDEIEKAHPEVFNLLLQILEDGQLTDAAGQTVNFKNTIIIMTANIGLRELNQNAVFGFSAQTPAEKDQAEEKYQIVKKQILTELKEKFRPEFLNRIDRTVIFRPLTKEDIKKITKLQIEEFQIRLRELGVQLQINQPAHNLIAEQSFLPTEGARAVRKTIQELLEDKLADKLLDDSASRRMVEGLTVKTKVIKKQIVLT
ncbi:MAG: ATP-dependent Clp protease ATP-binding subunit [bacterium]